MKCSLCTWNLQERWYDVNNGLYNSKFYPKIHFEWPVKALKIPRIFNMSKLKIMTRIKEWQECCPPVHNKKKLYPFSECVCGEIWYLLFDSGMYLFKSDIRFFRNINILAVSQNVSLSCYMELNQHIGIKVKSITNQIYMSIVRIYFAYFFTFIHSCLEIGFLNINIKFEWILNQK